MQVSRWGNSLAIRIPKKLAKEMQLKEGDDVALSQRAPDHLELANGGDESRRRALEALASLRLELPPGYKFDREEIYEERMRELGW